jgi:hypothetical protein
MGETERERGMGIGELGNYRNREGEGNGMGTEWEWGIGELYKPRGRGEWDGNRMGTGEWDGNKGMGNVMGEWKPTERKFITEEKPRPRGM